MMRSQTTLYFGLSITYSVFPHDGPLSLHTKLESASIAEFDV